MVSKTEAIGTPYEPQSDEIDEWSKAIYARLCEWAASKVGIWERWEPGYLLLTIASMEGQELEPAVLYTADEELTVAFGSWKTRLPDYAPFEGDRRDVAALDAREVVEGWLTGQIRTATYFDPTNNWCGSVKVEREDVQSRLRYGLKFMAASRPSRIELRTSRREDWRKYTINGKEIQEVI